MACNSKPFASPSMSPKIDEKKKKKNFLSPRHNSLTFSLWVYT